MALYEQSTVKESELVSSTAPKWNVIPSSLMHLELYSPFLIKRKEFSNFVTARAKSGDGVH